MEFHGRAFGNFCHSVSKPSENSVTGNTEVKYPPPLVTTASAWLISEKRCATLLGSGRNTKRWSRATNAQKAKPQISVNLSRTDMASPGVLRAFSLFSQPFLSHA